MGEVDGRHQTKQTTRAMTTRWKDLKGDVMTRSLPVAPLLSRIILTINDGTEPRRRGDVKTRKPEIE